MDNSNVRRIIVEQKHKNMTSTQKYCFSLMTGQLIEAGINFIFSAPDQIAINIRKDIFDVFRMEGNGTMFYVISKYADGTTKKATQPTIQAIVADLDKAGVQTSFL